MSRAAVDDGGRAFPRDTKWNSDASICQNGSPGMSLRDWFAGQALQGFASESGRYDSTGAAADAYAWADAMIAARKGGES